MPGYRRRTVWIPRRPVGRAPYSKTAGGGLSQISGTSAGVGSQTGTLLGAGALAGTSAGVGSQTGTLQGAGTLAGTSAGVGDQAGALLGAGALAGTSAGVGSQTGALGGTAALAGTSAGTGSQAGTVLGAGALEGTSSGASTLTGSTIGCPDGRVVNTSILHQESDWSPPATFSIGENPMDRVLGWRIPAVNFKIGGFTDPNWGGGNIWGPVNYTSDAPTPTWDVAQYFYGDGLEGLFIRALTNGTDWNQDVLNDRAENFPGQPTAELNPGASAFFPDPGTIVYGPTTGHIWHYAVIATSVYRNGVPDTDNGRTYSDNTFTDPVLTYPSTPNYGFQLVGTVTGSFDQTDWFGYPFVAYSKIWIYDTQCAEVGVPAKFPTVTFSPSSGDGYRIGVLGRSDHAEHVVPGGGESGSGNGPDTLHYPFLPLLMVYGDGTGIRFTRAVAEVPPWEIDVSVTDPDEDAVDSQAAIEKVSSRDAEHTLHVLFTRVVNGGDPNVYRATSTSDGDTWTVEDDVPVFENASHPEVGYDPITGAKLEAAYRTGAIYGIRTYPGDDPTDEFRFNDLDGDAIPCDDDRFSISRAPNAQQTWTLLLQDGGMIKAYRSVDDWETWELVS